MEIRVSHETGAVPVTIFHLKDDLQNEEPLLGMAREAYASGMRNLLLDLEQVPYISSAGLRALQQVFNLLHDNQAEYDRRTMQRDIVSGKYRSPHLKLLNPSKNAMRALSVAGYDMFLDIHQNRSQAIAAFVDE